MFGSAFVYAPGRWRTSDGCVPVRVVWAHFMALSALRARAQIDTAAGIGLAFSGEDGAEDRRQAHDDAFPEG